MRNGKHYVAVRMTPEEKKHFLNICSLCKVPEKTVLYWLTEKMIVHQKIPDDFFKITRLLTDIQCDVGHIWVIGSGILETTKYKYYRLMQIINKYESRISLKGVLSDPYYGEGSKSFYYNG